MLQSIPRGLVHGSHAWLVVQTKAADLWPANLLPTRNAPLREEFEAELDSPGADLEELIGDTPFELLEGGERVGTGYASPEEREEPAPLELSEVETRNLRQAVDDLLEAEHALNDAIDTANNAQIKTAEVYRPVRDAYKTAMKRVADQMEALEEARTKGREGDELEVFYAGYDNAVPDVSWETLDPMESEVLGRARDLLRELGWKGDTP